MCVIVFVYMWGPRLGSSLALWGPPFFMTILPLNFINKWEGVIKIMESHKFTKG